MIHPRAHVHPSARVSPHAMIAADVTIGAGCLIKAGAVIGTVGFGHEPPDETGHRELRPHSFGVVIGSDVHVGANTCIDQGRWRDTEIHDGARIDNLVHVAHNAIVGRNVVLVAHCLLGGSCEVGEGSFIGGGTLIREGVKIGSGVLTGLGSVVVSDLPDGVLAYGNPAALHPRTEQHPR